MLLAVADFQRRADFAVDEQHGAFAAEEVAEVAAAVGRQQLAALVEPHVGQEHDEVVAEGLGVGGVLDDERAVETAADLRRGIRVRVIPIGPGVAQLELVAELAAALDRRLRDARRAVHLVRHAQAVPVNRGRLGQGVLEVDDDAVTELGANHRSRHRAVVRPRRRLEARHDFDVLDARLELDLEHVGIGVQILRNRHRELVGPARGLARRRAQPAAPAGSAARSQAVSRASAGKAGPQRSRA